MQKAVLTGRYARREGRFIASAEIIIESLNLSYPD